MPETQEEEKGYIYYKIQPNVIYRVWRKDFNGKTFYNIMMQQKNYDGTVTKYYRPVTFKKNVEIPNETDIKILAGVENLRPNKNDSYNPITAIQINEFEIVKRQEQVEAEALSNFRDNLNERENGSNYDLPF